jgi:hypothetical protein
MEKRHSDDSGSQQLSHNNLAETEEIDRRVSPYHSRTFDSSQHSTGISGHYDYSQEYPAMQMAKAASVKVLDYTQGQTSDKHDPKQKEEDSEHYFKKQYAFDLEAEGFSANSRDLVLSLKRHTPIQEVKKLVLQW